MIPTVLLGPPSVFLAGSLVALASRKLVRAHGDNELERVALIAAAYGLWYGLVAAYAFFVYPDWSLAYLQDGEALYKPIAYLFYLFILAGCAAAGAVTAGWFALRGHGRVACAAAFCGLFAVLSVWRLTWRQYWTLASYREFLTLDGPVRQTAEVAWFRTSANITGALVLVPLLALLVWRHRLGRKVPGQESKA